MSATPDFARLRKDFPILSRKVYDKPLVYLDNAASAQKPRQMLQAMRQMAETNYANVHRGLHSLSNEATKLYEDARVRVQHFINAEKPEEIIFTANATDAINLVASSYGGEHIGEGDEIILSGMEHHANIVPWHFLRERQGAVLKWIPFSEEGHIEVEDFSALLSPRTKLVALTHMSNVLGVRPPVEAIIKLARERGLPVLLDGCQAIVHGKVDVRALDCDFYAFSAHKLYGPTGLGVLYGRKALLEKMRPYRGGGEMIREVRREKISYGDVPHRFEAGTPPFVQAVGLAAAMDYVEAIGADNIAAHENRLAAQAREALRQMNDIRLLGAGEAPIIAFTAEAAHPHDIATIMDRQGVAVRAGHHCAQPLLAQLGLTACLRASFALYNNEEDVERFVKAVKYSIGFFK